MTSEIRVTNTLSRQTEDFVPVSGNEVKMYVCGPTVQSPPHLGHGRAGVAFDMIRRYLAYRGYEVTFVRNITDVEDKIIAAAAETGETTEELSARVARMFEAAYDGLSVLEPDVEPKATEHISEMLEMIGRLIDRGLAYPTENGDVYYSVRTLESYGRLSGQDVDEMRAGTREIVGDLKHDPVDFALWKAAKPGEPSWDSPWGPGRPGWHIECSAMAQRYLGETFDIHGGGTDLIFPHHENEIAQSEGANGVTFAKYWLHNGMVNLGGEKMSKSTGHLIDLLEAVDRYGGAAVRLFYLRAHYRSPLEFSEALIDEARTALRRISGLLGRVEHSSHDAEPEVIASFIEKMDDDFNTPDALGVVFDTVREANRRLDAGETAGALAAAVAEMIDVLGIAAEAADDDLSEIAAPVNALATELGVEPGATSGETLDRLLERRSVARSERDFATSDRIRDDLAALGISIEDGPDGSNWHRR
jgi:cysteinyl-tRNA synthetase